VSGVFHKPIALHMTLGVLTLVDDYERVAAIEALNEGVQKVVQRLDFNPLIHLFIFQLKFLSINFQTQEVLLCI